VKGPEGNYAAEGRYGGTYTGYHSDNYYHANVNVNQNINVNHGWGAYYGPGWGAVAAGAAAGLAVGAVVASLPSAAQPVVVNSQNYYFAGGAYYQPCYQGAELSYCVVDNPNY
jgi:hypothetical protein